MCSSSSQISHGARPQACGKKKSHTVSLLSKEPSTCSSTVRIRFNVCHPRPISTLTSPRSHSPLVARRVPPSRRQQDPARHPPAHHPLQDGAPGPLFLPPCRLVHAITLPFLPTHQRTNPPTHQAAAEPSRAQPAAPPLPCASQTPLPKPPALRLPSSPVRPRQHSRPRLRS
jgi:hypothetical protein